MRKKKTTPGSGVLDNLPTEQPNPVSSDIDMCTTERILQIINQEDRLVANAVRKENSRIAQAVNWIVESFQQKRV